MLQANRDRRHQQTLDLLQVVDLPTSRELDIWSGIAAGLSNEQIAVRLTISIRTVENYINTLYKKLQCKNRVQLARKHWLNQSNIRL